jgi:hypothetical protein
MRNRAKCKLCGDIIESMHSTDLQACKCGQIYVDGGDALSCGSYDWNNFLRVDDEGNEIIVTVQKKENNSAIEKFHKPNQKELLDMLDEMRKNIENLPQHAMLSPITHADFCSLLILLSSIFRAED